MIRDELRRAAIYWDVHRIRPSTNLNSPPGRPDTLYFMPSLLAQDVDVAEEVCCCDPPPDCLDPFAQLATTKMNDLGLDKPQSPEAAKALYIKLL